MDIITKELNDKIEQYEFGEKTTDVACFKKIRMDYFLMLTIAAAWDLKKSSMDNEGILEVMDCLNRPEVGKLISICRKFHIDSRIVNIFDSYKEGRNLRFAHTTFDEIEAERLNSECQKCWDALVRLQRIDDKDSETIRNLYQGENDLYYIAVVKPDGEMLVRQFGSKNSARKIKKIDFKAWLSNKDNDITEGDLFILVNGQYIKISPFIMYNDEEELFMMLMDIEKSPLPAFKMAYIYRTKYARESAKYLDDFPKELKSYFPEEAKKNCRNGIYLNRFSQYSLFEQEYYKDVHSDVQKQLDSFISGNMAYGAVRGVGGVGKTSAVFMWMNRIMNNEGGILDRIRQKFNLRKIIFLSAKTKIYSREINATNLSNFYDVKSDVGNYRDIVETIYAIFHTMEGKNIQFDDKVDYIKNYSNQSHAVLIIIDDYESLPLESRNEIQQLKDSLKPDTIKMLITTRFISKESKDITVNSLNQDECAKMTDYIFGSDKWREDLPEKKMHELTGGLPLLIWYAKAFFKAGQLTDERLKKGFSGPAEGLENYLFDNFVQCFEDKFTKNFLMIAARYYDLHRVMQISGEIAVFLCLEEPKEYKAEDEEFYFRELTDLKLISINKSANTVDFSPLMTYMDKTSKRQEAEETYQEDSLKILVNLDEAEYKNLHAVIESAEFLEDETKCRVLERVMAFPGNDGKVRNLAISRMFELTDDKLKLYEAYEHIFQNDKMLTGVMTDYLLKNRQVISGKYELVRDFIKSVSVSINTSDSVEQTSCRCIELIKELLSVSLEERDNETVTNRELGSRTQLLCGMLKDFFSKIADSGGKENFKKEINELLENISVYCPDVEKIG